MPRLPGGGGPNACTGCSHALARAGTAPARGRGMHQRRQLTFIAQEVVVQEDAALLVQDLQGRGERGRGARSSGLRWRMGVLGAGLRGADGPRRSARQAHADSQTFGSGASPTHLDAWRAGWVALGLLQARGVAARCRRRDTAGGSGVCAKAVSRANVRSRAAGRPDPPGGSIVAHAASRRFTDYAAQGAQTQPKRGRRISHGMVSRLPALAVAARASSRQSESCRMASL